MMRGCRAGSKDPAYGCAGSKDPAYGCAGSEDPAYGVRGPRMDYRYQLTAVKR
jgi:hypothetical protein